MKNESPLVLLDACVLYPAPLRNLFMWLAVEEVIHPKWTDEIQEEWIRNVLKNRPDLTRTQLMRTRELMDLHAGDCLVQGYEKHIPNLNLPDPDDRHVLAAAIESEAQIIVTWNRKDFPQRIVSGFNITVSTPDALISDLLRKQTAAVLDAIELSRTNFRNPPFTILEYRELLARQGLNETVRLLKEAD